MLIRPVAQINGKPIYINDELTKRVVPNKLLPHKQWHLHSRYAQRVQKKWNKLHGTRIQDHIVSAPFGILCSTAAWLKVRAQLAKDNLLC